jgi:hypothetical protein
MTLLICSKTGTILTVEDCYIIPDEAADDLDILETMSDSEVGDWAREHGTPVIPQAS